MNLKSAHRRFTHSSTPGHLRSAPLCMSAFDFQLRFKHARSSIISSRAWGHTCQALAPPFAGASPRSIGGFSRVSTNLQHSEIWRPVPCRLDPRLLLRLLSSFSLTGPNLRPIEHFAARRRCGGWVMNSRLFWYPGLV